MASEMLGRSDLTAYVVAGVPKSFAAKLKKLVQGESSAGDVLPVDEELPAGLVANLQGEKRRPHEKTAASAALWRAYRALSAARYHLQDRPEEEQVRELRALVEDLWREISPQFQEEDEEEAEES